MSSEHVYPLIKFHLNMFALNMTIHEVSCSCIEFIHTARSSQPLVASGQPLVASSQLLVESSQLLVASSQLLVESSQLLVESSQLRMHLPLEVPKPPTMCG